jgi:hypothetical protein
MGRPAAPPSLWKIYFYFFVGTQNGYESLPQLFLFGNKSFSILLINGTYILGTNACGVTVAFGSGGTAEARICRSTKIMMVVRLHNLQDP